MLYMPTEEELQNKIERQKNFYRLQHTEKINRVTTYGEKIGYNDEHSTTLISSMKIAIKKHPVT